MSDRNRDVLNREVFTPLGRGRVVYLLGDGTLLVEFQHGGGKVYLPQELFGVNVSRKETFPCRDRSMPTDL